MPLRSRTVRLRGMETGISEASKRVSIFSFATPDAVPDAVPDANVAAATNTSLPSFTGGNKVYSGKRWLPMVMDNWKIACRVENATYMYLLQEDRSVAREASK